MKAADIMTRQVAKVPPDATVRDIAHRMAEKRISGVPVVSADGEVLGIVSESDLLRRVELGSEAAPAKWTAAYANPSEAAEAFVKTHGMKAHDVMARPVVSVEQDTDIADIADTLARHHIKRVPVISDGKLVGIIARSDIVRAFSQMEPKDVSVHLGSGAIHETVSKALGAQGWLDTSYINISVKDAVVRVSGYVQSKEHREAARVLIEEVPGVERVEDNLKVGLPVLNWDGTLQTN